MKFSSIIFFCLVSIVHATTYYVDPTLAPVTGQPGQVYGSIINGNFVMVIPIRPPVAPTANNTNSGLSTNSAWVNLPGTRNALDNAFISTNWGPFRTDNRIPPGTTFNIKSGTSLTGTNSGRVQIDASYYTNGTNGAPITIQRDTTWGSGDVVLDGTLMAIAPFRGIITIDNIKYVTIDGKTTSGITINNSTYNGIRCTSVGTNGYQFKNLELSHALHSLLLVNSTGGAQTNFINGVNLDNVIAHDGTGVADTDSLIYLGFVDDFTVNNCTAYNSGIGSDAIHLGSSKNGFITSCTVHNAGEQGIDVSRDGSFKTRDDAFNVTVRDCVSYDCFINAYDHNSGAHHVYWINDFAWRTTSGVLGDSCFNIHEGTAGPNWWINCSSSKSSDRGYNAGMSGNPWGIPAGTNHQYMMNCVSSGDSIVGGVSASGSFRAEDIGPPNGAFMQFHFYNCDLNTTSQVYGTALVTNLIFSAANITNYTGGWVTYGTNSFCKDPLWKSTNYAWNANSQVPETNSPCLNSGTDVFLTTSAGVAATSLVVQPKWAPTDARRVFKAGDSIIIAGSATGTVSSVSQTNTIILSSALSWSSNQSVWFTGKYPLQIGAK